MTHDIETLRTWLQWVLGVAAFFTTAFPLLWFFSIWTSTVTGKLLMFWTLSFALVLDVTVLFQFWKPTDILVLFWTEAIMFSLIAVSSAAMTFRLYWVNYHEDIMRRFKKGRKK